jgi:membrane peptidoglycan carboxypeptidase
VIVLALSIVLGGAEVKLLEHVGAYGVFAQEGQRAEISPILKIEDKNGKVIEEYKEKKTEVLDVQVARQINSVLSDDSARSYVFGSGSKLTLPGRPVAAKTGTTNNFHDAWIVGYTPSLVAGVWVGNADNKPMSKGADGSVIAAPIWNQFMKEALKDSAVENFNAPEEVITGKPVWMAS